jgi:hypothetical protein
LFLIQINLYLLLLLMKIVQATHDYDPHSEERKEVSQSYGEPHTPGSELKFKKDDYIVITRDDDDWPEGFILKKTKSRGFPKTFVEGVPRPPVATDAGSGGVSGGDDVVRATVAFDYEAEDDTNITIAVGDVVVVTDKSDAGWWEGHVEGKADKVGFFPSSFVELIASGDGEAAADAAAQLGGQAKKTRKRKRKRKRKKGGMPPDMQRERERKYGKIDNRSLKQRTKARARRVRRRDRTKVRSAKLLFGEKRKNVLKRSKKR